MKIFTPSKIQSWLLIDSSLGLGIEQLSDSFSVLSFSGNLGKSLGTGWDLRGIEHILSASSSESAWTAFIAQWPLSQMDGMLMGPLPLTD